MNAATPREIVLDLPAPPSVNRTRKVDWRGNAKLTAWHARADGEVMACRWRRADPVQRFELHIAVADDDGADIDNITKAVGDYLRRIEVVADDSRRHMRELNVKVDPLICPGMIRVTIKPIGSAS